METKTELWIMNIIGFILFIVSVYTICFHIGDVSVPDWYPDVVDMRLIGIVVGLADIIISTLLLREEYRIKIMDEVI